jgi:hypothetical protein
MIKDLAFPSSENRKADILKNDRANSEISIIFET